MHRLQSLLDRRDRWGTAFTGAMILVAFVLLAPAAVRSQVQDAVPGATGAAGMKSDTASAKPDTATSAHPRILMTVEKRGEIVIELLPEQAPKACKRILTLVSSGFYSGLRFHRVESYLVQTGAGESKLGAVEGEMFSRRLSHDAGMVGMARLPDNYDSATTQFYIMKEHRPLLNGEYTLFGRVIQGMDVVRAIKKGDVINSIAVVKTP